MIPIFIYSTPPNDMPMPWVIKFVLVCMLTSSVAILAVIGWLIVDLLRGKD